MDSADSWMMSPNMSSRWLCNRGEGWAAASGLHLLLPSPLLGQVMRSCCCLPGSASCHTPRCAGGFGDISGEGLTDL